MSPKYALPPGRRGEAVLTIQQPWASAILHGGKDVENRSRSTNYRGRLWIHAGLKSARADQDRWAAKHDLWVPEEPLPRGVILGSVELVDVVRDSDSPWGNPGDYHWILRRPMLLERPTEWTGRLGMTYIRPPRGRVRAARRSRKSYS